MGGQGMMTLEEAAAAMGVPVSPEKPPPEKTSSEGERKRKRNNELSPEQKKRKRMEDNARYAALNRAKKKAAAEALEAKAKALEAEVTKLRAKNAMLEAEIRAYRKGDEIFREITGPGYPFSKVSDGSGPAFWAMSSYVASDVSLAETWLSAWSINITELHHN